MPAQNEHLESNIGSSLEFTVELSSSSRYSSAFVNRNFSTSFDVGQSSSGIANSTVLHPIDQEVSAGHSFPNISPISTLPHFKRPRINNLSHNSRSFSNITNPFDSRLIESLSDSAFSPGVFKRRQKNKNAQKVSPDSFWSPNSMSILRPAEIDESQLDEEQSDHIQRDPSFESKAQAAIEQYWAKSKFIVPSPGVFTSPMSTQMFFSPLSVSTCGSRSRSDGVSSDQTKQGCNSNYSSATSVLSTERVEFYTNEQNIVSPSPNDEVFEELERSFFSPKAESILADLDYEFVQCEELRKKGVPLFDLNLSPIKSIFDKS